MLRARAAQKLLQWRKFLRRSAAGKPVFHAGRSRNDTLKHQVADGAEVKVVDFKVCFLLIAQAAKSASFVQSYFPYLCAITRPKSVRWHRPTGLD